MTSTQPRARGRRLRRWWLGVLALGVFLAALGAAVWHFGLRQPVGEGPAGPQVPRVAFERPWSTRPVRLVGLGDSITAGFGASPGFAYFERLVRNPPGEFPEMQGLSLGRVFPALSVTNLAVSGSTSLHHAEKQIPRLPPAGPETLGIAVLTTGGNDLIHDYGRNPPREGAMYGATEEQAAAWIAAFEQRLEGMIVEITRRFPGGCHIFLANIYDPTDGLGDVGWTGLPPWRDGLAVHRAYNEVIARCAERHPEVHLVDLRGTFLGHGIHCAQFWRSFYRRDDPHYWYGANLEDPNDRGYDAVRRVFLRRMAEVLGPSR